MSVKQTAFATCVTGFDRIRIRRVRASGQRYIMWIKITKTQYLLSLCQNLFFAGELFGARGRAGASPKAGGAGCRSGGAVSEVLIRAAWGSADAPMRSRRMLSRSFAARMVKVMDVAKNAAAKAHVQLTQGCCRLTSSHQSTDSPPPPSHATPSGRCKAPRQSSRLRG